MVDHVPYVHDLSVNYVSGGHPIYHLGADRERGGVGRVPRRVLIIRKLFAGRHVGPSGELELVASRPCRVPDRNNIGDVRVPFALRARTRETSIRTEQPFERKTRG